MRPAWPPAPRPRLVREDGLDPTLLPNVKVPLTVTFPLGPHTLELYLKYEMIHYPPCVEERKKNDIPFRVICDWHAGVSG